MKINLDVRKKTKFENDNPEIRKSKPMKLPPDPNDLRMDAMQATISDLVKRIKKLEKKNG